MWAVFVDTDEETRLKRYQDVLSALEAFRKALAEEIRNLMEIDGEVREEVLVGIVRCVREVSGAPRNFRPLIAVLFDYDGAHSYTQIALGILEKWEKADSRG